MTHFSWFRLWVCGFVTPVANPKGLKVVFDWPILRVATDAPKKLAPVTSWWRRLPHVKWDLPHPTPKALHFFLAPVSWKSLTWFEIKREINSKENRVGNGSWALKQIKCIDQTQTSKIVHFERLKFSYAFLRVLTQILGFLTQILGFLTHSYAVLFCTQPGVSSGLDFLAHSYALLRTFLDFLHTFWAFNAFLRGLLGYLFVLFALCTALGDRKWVLSSQRANWVFFLHVVVSTAFQPKQILKRISQSKRFTSSFRSGLSSKASSESRNLVAAKV